MANCCLLIETIESFKQGIGDTSGNSKKMFVDFFKSETNFKLFEKKTDLFYSKVRCGILHQGETTGGWILLRKGKQLFDSENLKISPKKFLDEIEISLKKYKSLLENEDWDSEIWDNFRRKMRIIIKNCQK